MNLSALDGRGAAMKTARFDIKVLHKSNSRKKGMARGREGKKFGNAAKGLENAVLTLQGVGSLGGMMMKRKLK